MFHVYASFCMIDLKYATTILAMIGHMQMTIGGLDQLPLWRNSGGTRLAPGLDHISLFGSHWLNVKRDFHRAYYERDNKK